MPSFDPLPARIGRAAATAPDRPAVCDPTEVLTFAQLWERSGRVAARLAGEGVGRGDRVAVVGDSRAETVVALLGVLRCGAAFVPVDAGAPIARRAALLADAAARAVLGPDGLPVAEAAAGPPPPAPASEGAPALGPGDVAYCMYTSGSTGAPKGVQIDHGALVAFLDAVAATARVQPGSRCLNTAPFHFDASVLFAWFPLTVGATVYVTPGLLLPDRVLDVIERERISHVGAVTPVLSALRRARTPLAERDLSRLSHVLTGADVLDPAVAREWLAAAPTARIVNEYGPTEATCCCLAHVITVDNVHDVPYPIGRPFAGVETVVLDDHGAPCPRGAVGELLLAGPQLTAGYLNRPDENAAKLLQRDGRRWYRTGDLVVQDAAGVFHFKGRVDHEIKVRGYRIHPAEVATALRRCDGVVEAHVTAVTDERGERILVAAVAPREGAELSGLALRDELRASLPEYMVPRRVTVLPALPRLASGKVDDRAVAAAT